MAQGRLTRAAALASVLILGAGVEAAAPAATAFETAADWAVGAALACGGAWRLGTGPGRLALLTAIAWYLGTLSGADSGAPADLGSACVLAYRGPLLHLLLTVPAGRLSGNRTRALAAAGWIGGFLPLDAAGPVTAACAAVVAALALGRATRSAAGDRQALLATGTAAAALSAVWWLAALELAGRTTLLVLNDVAVLAAGAVALSACAGAWARQAAGTLVIELGADRGAGRPVTAQLARALGDPSLELRYAVPGVGWVDERGNAVPAPDGGAVTRAVVPGGGEVALVHGAVGAGDARLAEAAAAAAALALDSARLEAAVQASAADVRASRRRLLTAADAERRALEQRLSDGPIAGLRRVDRLLAAADTVAQLQADGAPTHRHGDGAPSHRHTDRAPTYGDGAPSHRHTDRAPTHRHGDGAGELRAELRAAIAELADLGRGLYPPALARADLAGALAEIAARSPVPTSVHVSGDPRALSDELRATAWFVCSEALANVARHSHATEASIAVAIDAAALRIDVRDDGRGGATPTRGLRGLADRVEASGGTLTIVSPAGGPTAISARLPVA